MHGIRVIEVDIFFGEEDEGGTHEDIHSTLCPRIVDEFVSNEEGELTQEFSQGAWINFMELSVRVLFLYAENVGRCFFGKDPPVVLEDGDTLNWEVEPLWIGLFHSCFELFHVLVVV